MFIEIYNRVRKFLFTKGASFHQWYGDWSRRQKAIFAGALGLPLILVGLFAIVLPLGNPLQPLAQENAFPLAGPEIGNPTTPAPTANPPELAGRISALNAEIAFWQARLQMNKSDSVNLSIDLSRGVINLEIRGVVVRQCQIAGVRKSNMFAVVQHHPAFTAWLSAPFTLQSSRATTLKSPIIIKEAPKDTSEVEFTEPVPPEKDDVFIFLKFDRNLAVEIEQAEAPAWTGWVEYRWQALRQRFTETATTLKMLARGSVPKHSLWITLKVSREDARAIYRALPGKAKMSLKYAL